MDELLTDPLDLTGQFTAQDNSLNGSTAPNSGTIPLSTPVNTSGGNTNTSGWSLAGILSGLSGLGSSATSAYNTIAGRPATAAPASTAAASLTAYLPWLLIGGGVLLVIALFARK